MTQCSFTLPRREEFVHESCLRTVNMDSKPTPLAVRVIDAVGKPVSSASVDIVRLTETRGRAVRESLITDEGGVATSCLIFHGDDSFAMTVTRAGQPPLSDTFRCRKNELTVRLPAARSR